MARSLFCFAMTALGVSLAVPTSAVAQRAMPNLHRGLSAQHAFHAGIGYTANWNIHRPGYSAARALPARIPSYYTGYRHHYGPGYLGYRNPLYGYSYYRSCYSYGYGPRFGYPYSYYYPPRACFFPTGTYFYFSAPTFISPIFFAARLGGNADPARPVDARIVGNVNPQQDLARNGDAQGLLDVLHAHEAAELARKADAKQLDGVALADLLRRSRDATDKNKPSAESMARGERAFQEGDYAAAVGEFQRAAEKAPGNITAWLNLGFAEIAGGDYDAALAAFRAAARQADSFERGDCELDRLYAANSQVKLAHLDRLAKSTLADPASPDRWLLVGAFLWFDGQSERADKFLAKAQSLAAPQDDLLLAQTLRGK